MGFLMGLLWFSGALFGHSQAKYTRKKKVSFLVSMILLVFVFIGLSII